MQISVHIKNLTFKLEYGKLSSYENILNLKFDKSKFDPNSNFQKTQ